MTAEIVVMNRESLVLAADSAVSSKVGDETKVSTSANKLFSLSYRHPVGIMIYGNASFMGLPWETIIKYYRNHHLPSTGFDTLEDYADNFVQYLSSSNINFKADAEEEYVSSFIYSFFQSIRKEIEYNLERLLQSGEDITEDLIHTLCSQVSSERFEKYRRNKKVLRINDCRLILQRYDKQVRDIYGHIFNHFTLGRNLRAQLTKTLLYAFARIFLDNISSGIVIAGFGHNDFTPVVKPYDIEGLLWLKTDGELKGILKHQVYQEGRSGDADVSVIAFAQKDMVQRFMNGVDIKYYYASSSFLEDICDDFINKIVSKLDKYNAKQKEDIKSQLESYSSQIVRAHNRNMAKFVDRYFSQPILSAVARLPKDELVVMAEALVHLTSLKRKISQDPETVAGPIDVAVITKGDGFIWIKRKHYFEPNLNPDYFLKRFKELSNENT